MDNLKYCHNVYAVLIKHFKYNGFVYEYVKLFVSPNEDEIIEITELFKSAKQIKYHGWVLKISRTEPIDNFIKQLNDEHGLTLRYYGRL